MKFKQKLTDALKFDTLHKTFPSNGCEEDSETDIQTDGQTEGQ